MEHSILLASKSPRRKDILRTLNMPFTVCPSEVDESLVTETNPVKLVEALALLKAKAVINQAHNNQIILGSDTIVVDGDQILGKPKNEADVFKYLSSLSGRDHQVISAIALIDINQEIEVVGHSVTQVSFKEITQEEITVYCQSGEPFDKAGAYGIQGLGSAFVTGIQGDYNNVVGLPVSLLLDLLSQLGYVYYKDLYKH